MDSSTSEGCDSSSNKLNSNDVTDHTTKNTEKEGEVDTSHQCQDHSTDTVESATTFTNSEIKDCEQLDAQKAHEMHSGKRYHSPITATDGASSPKRICYDQGVVAQELKVDEADAVTGEKCSDRRKSKRRSSFVRGRLSKVFPSQNSAEVCQNISKDVPANERLSKLCEATVEYSLQKLSKENSSLSGMQQFEVEARDAVHLCVYQMKLDGVLEDAVSPKKKTITNPENLKMQEAIQKCSTHIQRLRNESNSWDVLVQGSKEFAENCTGLTDESEVSMRDVPQAVRDKYRHVFDTRPDLPNLLRSVGVFKEKTVLTCDSIAHKIWTLQKFKTCAERHIKSMSGAIYQTSFPGIVNSSPRKLLEDCISKKIDV